MVRTITSVFNFQEYIQTEAVNRRFSFFSTVVGVLFDNNYYLRSNPDVAQAIQNGSLGSGFAHFVARGLQEGRTPSAFFDEDLYLFANPDVKVAVQNGSLSSGLQHYFQNGFSEGRDALALTTEIGGIEISALFDEAHYLFLNSDIKVAVQQQIFSYGYEHFLRFGLAEGRNPSLYYNEDIYLSQNQDVKEAVEADIFTSGLQHYLLAGHLENRVASALFDPAAYLAKYTDIAAAIANGSISSAFEHFIEVGAQEGRDSSQLYQDAFYLAQNPDVADAIANGVIKTAYEHFVKFGIKEGRTPSATYDEISYLAANPDVQAAVSNKTINSGLEHYIKFGRLEGRPLKTSAPPPGDGSLLPGDAADYSTAENGVILNLNEEVALLPVFGALSKPRLMPLGDSITAGEHRAGRVPGGYRIQFWERAVADGLTIDFVGGENNSSGNLGDGDHEGHPGWQINQLQNGRSSEPTEGKVSDWLTANPADLIMLMIGTNDANSGVSATAMRDRLSALIDAITNQAPNSYLLVSSITPLDVPSGTASEAQTVASYNALIPALVEQKIQQGKKVLYSNVGGSLTVPDLNGDNSATFDVNDGLHPSIEGYEKLGNLWYDAVFNPQSLAGQESVIGSRFSDRLIGDSNQNGFEGGKGNDLLTGGGGSDRFLYRSFNEGFDTITDFSANDEIRVVAAGFLGGLSAGFNLGQAVSQGSFVKSSNPSATGNQATFLYNTSTGVLSYDRDGVGGQSATDLVKLENFFDLMSSQIVVV